MRFLSFFLLLLGLYSCNKTPPLKTGLEGSPLPSFNLLLEDSVSKIDPSHSSKGSPVVLFYFTPGCPYCQAELKGIITHISSLNDIHFYLFTCARFAEMKAFSKYFQLQKYRNIRVGVDYDSAFGKVFDAYGVPYTAIYNKDQRLVHAYIGRINSQQILDIARN